MPDHPVPEPLRSTFRQIAGAFVAGDFQLRHHPIDGLRPIDPDTAKRIADNVSAYGEALAPLNLLSLPRRRLIRSNDRSCDFGSFFLGGQNGHEGRCGNFHDCHALSDCCPTYINRLAVQGLRTHRDPADRFSNRNARIAPQPLMRLPLFCFNPGPRRLAMSKRSGDDTNRDCETNRNTESGSHQADTSRRPSVYAGVTRVLPSCTGQAGRS